MQSAIGVALPPSGLSWPHHALNHHRPAKEERWDFA